MRQGRPNDTALHSLDYDLLPGVAFSSLRTPSEYSANFSFRSRSIECLHRPRIVSRQLVVKHGYTESYPARYGTEACGVGPIAEMVLQQFMIDYVKQGSSTQPAAALCAHQIEPSGPEGEKCHEKATCICFGARRNLWSDSGLVSSQRFFQLIGVRRF